MQPPKLPDDEPLRLSILHERAILDTPPEERFDRLTRLAGRIFGVPIALVSLVDAERQWFKSRHGLDACETGRDISFCGHAILGEGIFEISDARLDPRFADNPLVTGAPHIRFYAGMPLTTPEGYRLGTLCLISDSPRQLSANERQILRDLAGCVEDEINQSKLKQRSQELKQAQQLGEVITRAQSQFIRESDRRRAFDGLLSDILSLTQSEYGFIGEVLYTPQRAPYLKTYAITDIAWNAETRAFYEANAPKGMEFFNLKTLFGAALTSGAPVISNAPAKDPRRGGLPEGHPALDAFLGIPVYHGDELVAMVGLSNRPGGYDQALIDFLQPLLVTLGQLVAAARVQQQHRLNQKELARFKNTLDRTLDCVFMFDATALRFFYANEGGMLQVGYSIGELLAMHPYEITSDISEAEFHALLAPLLAGEQDALTFETVHKHKYGKRVPVEIFLQYIAPADEPARFVAIVRDLTERKRVERMKREFVSTVSHELRTPLTSISGALGLLAGGITGPLSEPAQNLVGIAHQNSLRLTSLINDLLDMEKLLAGRIAFDLQPHALMPLLQQSIRDIQAYADQRKVRLQLNESCSAVLKVDAQRFGQIMANLLSNAIKFSPAEGTVTVSACCLDDQVRTEIRDYGPGIPVEFRERIFQKFSQADASDSRQRGGTGLGLAISKELVERMAGRIGFESEEGAGAVFYFELPVFPMPAAGVLAGDTELGPA